LWDLKTGEEIATLSVFGARVTSVAFDPGTTRLAATSFDAKARVWDLEALLAGPAEEPPPLLTLELDAPVWDVVFSPDGGRLATISFDGQARLWDAETGQETLVLREYNNGPNLAFSPDGKHLATTSGDGVVRVFVLPIDDLMALARSRLTRAPTGEECRQYLHLETCPPD
jgi:WD40 repeat protein